MKIGIVILNYMNYYDTIECIKSIIDSLASQKNKENEYILFIIDNNSPNNSFKCLYKYITKIELPKSMDIELIQSNENLGFGGGNNIGIEYLFNEKSCEFVFLINSDAKIIKFDDTELNNMIKRHNCEIIGAHFISESANKKKKIGGAIFNKYTFLSKDLSCYHTTKKFRDYETFYLSGAFFGMSKSVYSTIGKLEEGFFLYFEELEWTFRAERLLKRKLKVYIAPHFQVCHRVGGATGNTASNKPKKPIAEYYSARARILFAKQVLPKHLVNAFAYNMSVVASRIIRGHWKNIYFIILGTIHGLKGIQGIQNYLHP